MIEENQQLCQMAALIPGEGWEVSASWNFFFQLEMQWGAPETNTATYILFGEPNFKTRPVRFWQYCRAATYFYWEF